MWQILQLPISVTINSPRDGTGLEVVQAPECLPAAHPRIDAKVISVAG